MGKKNTIIEILAYAGFEEGGKNQFTHPKHGTLFLKSYTCQEMTEKLMLLGMRHKEHEIKKALGVVEEFAFKPQA